MLERAKACLQSGARETLRCATTPKRSRRLLHLTFWQHGAGDLDLPPWAVSKSSTSAHSPIRCGGDSEPTRRRSKAAGRSGKEGTWAPSGEGVFLDFLYPPQALALLRTASRQNNEKWEKRNARRLPEGYVQASRGYASRARSKRSERRKEDRGEELSRLAEADMEGSSEREEPSREADPLIGEDGENTILPDPHELDEDPAQGNSGSRMVGSSATHINLPLVDLDTIDEEGPEPTSPSIGIEEASVDPLQKLRSLLGYQRRTDDRTNVEKRLALTKRVLATYESLKESDRCDLRLKLELLHWLSGQKTSEGNVKCSELYHSIPLQHRTLPVYIAALTVFLRRGLHVQAVKLHREALTNIPNGDQVTKSFFGYAVNNDRWQLAMNVEAQYRQQGRKGFAGEKMFWLHVSEMPDLMRKACKLDKHLRGLQRARTTNRNVDLFCARFFVEALQQEFEARDPRVTPPAFIDTLEGPGSLLTERLIHMIRHIRSIGPEARVFYQRLIISMLSQRDQVYAYPRVHRLGSAAYQSLRSFKEPVPQEILMSLLEKLTYYWDGFRRHFARSPSITVSSVLSDWHNTHGKIDKNALHHVLRWHSSAGRVTRFDYWLDYYKRHYPNYEDQREVMQSRIYLHARRMDLGGAKDAFEDAMKLAKANGDDLPLKAWNILIHAHSRVDDIDGGISVLGRLIAEGYQPDEFSFHPITQMFADRGDVEGVKDLLAQYDDLAEKQRVTGLYGSLITAHANCGEVNAAEKVLSDAVLALREGKIKGSLTACFNIVLTAHAHRREVDDVLRVYKWMRDEKIGRSGSTYAALMQALVNQRQTQSAWRLLNKTMERECYQPTALHYAIVMAGYVKQRLYDDALRVHEDMVARNVKPSAGVNSVLVQARAAAEARKRRGALDREDRDPVEAVVNSFKQMMESRDGSDVAAHEPGFGRSSWAMIPEGYMSFLVNIHGKQICLDAIKRLFEQFNTSPASAGEERRKAELPIQLLWALMFVHLRAGDHAEVERCWLLANRQADKLARNIPVPSFANSHARDQLDLLNLRKQPDEAQEAGFSVTGPEVPSEASVNPQEKKTSLLFPSQPFNPASPIAPARRIMLTRLLRVYLISLFQQSRTRDLLSTVASHFARGYTLDNSVWNLLLRLLCDLQPPLALLAFTLCERFLIPQFPGWVKLSDPPQYSPLKSAKAANLEYMRARYLRPDQLMPHYKTMVVLGSTLLKLRRLEALGRRRGSGIGAAKGMEKYVGSIREIRRQAPRTVFAVRSMPNVDDALQNRYLRGL